MVAGGAEGTSWGPGAAAAPASPSRRATTLAIVALVWTLAVTISRAIRWPNDFAEAHWLLDYRFGFVKRGLVGELLGLVLAPFGAPPTETLIAALSVALFTGFVAVFAWVSVGLLRAAGTSAAATLVVLAAASSPFVVMSAHLIGYFDALLFVLAALACACVRTGRSGLAWAGAGLMALAVLVHETAVVYGLPVFALAWVVARAPRPSTAVLAIPLAAAAVVAIAPGFLLAADFQDQFSRRLATFPFVGGDMHLFVPEWLTPSALDHYREQSHRVIGRLTSAEMYGLMLPTVLALFCFTVQTRSRSALARPAVGMAVVVLATQAPHLAAWDTVRIWTYAIGAALLAAWVCARADPGAPVAAGSPVVTGSGGDAALRWLALVALAANVVMTTPLYDQQVDRWTVAARLLLYAPPLVIALAQWRRR